MMIFTSRTTESDTGANLLHSFTAIVDEALVLSAFPAPTVSLLRESLFSHYTQAVIISSTEYPDVTKVLYAINDNERYSVLSLSFVDKYMFFLVLADDVFPRHIFKKFISEAKKDSGLTGVALGEYVNEIRASLSALEEILKDSTKTTRQAAGSNGADEVELPSGEDLKLFYECGRKAKYFSEADAESSVSKTNGIYRCVHCEFFHQGKLPTGQLIPGDIMFNRHRTAWRRFYKV